MTRNAVTVTVLYTILLGSVPPTTQADEIYAAGPGELWRLGTDSNRITVVGPLDVFFTDLAFSDGGELYGLDRDNVLHRVDPESAETESLLSLDGSLIYWDFTVAPDGDLYLIRSHVDTLGTELTRLDPTGGTETLVAWLALAFYKLFSSDRQLIGEGIDSRFYTIDPLSGLTEELPGGGRSSWSFDVDLDSDGVLWVLADSGVDPSPRMLFARDFASGEYRSDKADYYWDFLYDGPSAFAIRRDRAADLYVSPTGSDANSGLTADDAFRTIQHAADLAAAGTTVHVLPGTYVEEVGVETSGTASSPITFRAAGGGPVILDGQHRGCPQGQRPGPGALEFGFVGWDAHRITIDGFEIKRFCFGGILFENSSWVEIRNCRIRENGVTLPEPGPGESLEGQGIYVEGNHFVIENNVVTDNVPRNADSGSGIVAWNADSVTVRNNVSERNNGNGILIEDCTNVLVEGNVVRSNVGDFGDWGTAGLWLDGGHTVTVRNNWFEDNVWSGLAITDETPSDPYGYEIYNNVAVGNWYGLWLDGIGRSDRTPNRIYNNTFVDNTRLGVWVSWEGIVGGSATQLTRTRFYNNLVAQLLFDTTALEVEAGSWDDVVFDHNLYYRQGTGAAIRWAGKDRTFGEYQSHSGWDGAGMAADPRLRSPAEQDFHLHAASPAIDAGTSAYPIPATDYEGHERPVGTAVDLGAFEVGNVAADCTSDATTLCLNQDRFSVQVAWRDFQGQTGTGRAVPLTGDTGYFWFFDQENIELVVKALDACVAPYHRFWLFAAGLTNVEVTMTVTDTVGEVANQYINPLNQPFAPILDTDAFDTCAAQPSPAAATGENELASLEAVLRELNREKRSRRKSAGELYLNDDRFRVEVTWSDSFGNTGAGRGVALTDETGYFWFFDEDNVELVVKVLDACADPSNRFWVFAAGLTDVEVTMTVTDTVTGQEKEYHNPLHQEFAPILDTHAFATCDGGQ